MDIQMKFDPERQTGDFVQLGGDLAIDRDLETAILVSLFTDRRADAGDRIPDGSADLRGCWMDALSDEPLGSRLWLLRREKIIPETVARMKEYIEEALQWVIQKKVAQDITVTCVPDRSAGCIDAAIVLTKNRQTRRYQYVWRQLNGV